MIIPDCLFQESNEKMNNLPRKVYKPAILKQIGRKNNKSFAKKLKKNL